MGDRESFSSVQSLSHVRLFATPWIAAHQASWPSPTPGVHSDSRPLSRWCHPAISSSVVPFCSCPNELCQRSFPDFGGCTDVTQQLLQCSELCLPEIYMSSQIHMLKSLTPNVQQYVNRELLDVQTGFRKGRGTRDQIVNICWIIKTATGFQKIIYFCFIDYAKAFDCVDHNKLWKILKETGIPDHLDLPLSVCRSRSNS